MSKNAANKPLDTRREKLQKIHKSTTDLHNLGALKYEETKPTFLPFFRPKHAIPQTLAPSAPPPTKKPKFLVFQTRKFCPVGFNTPGGPPLGVGKVIAILYKFRGREPPGLPQGLHTYGQPRDVRRARKNGRLLEDRTWDQVPRKLPKPIAA